MDFIASSALMAFLSHFSAVHTSEYCRYQVLQSTATLDHCAGKVLKNTMQENKAKNFVFLWNQTFYFLLYTPGYYNIHVILELFPHCMTFTKKCDKYPRNWMSSTIGVMLGISIMKTMPVLFILIFSFGICTALVVMCQFSLPHCRESLSSNDSVWQIQTTSTPQPWHLFPCNVNLYMKQLGSLTACSIIITTSRSGSQDDTFYQTCPFVLLAKTHSHID